MEKRIQEGIHNNPNNLIANLTNITLSNNEIKILKYGLKHCLAIRPKESEVIVIMEDMSKFYNTMQLKIAIFHQKDLKSL